MSPTGQISVGGFTRQTAWVRRPTNGRLRSYHEGTQDPGQRAELLDLKRLIE